MTAPNTPRSIANDLPAIQRQGLLTLAVKMQNQFHVPQAVQQAGMNHVH